ncbi:MAG: hypothetical protein GXO79_04540, partial [Chlorobi bacterium]|nr:hypothetical protein [Chlorobiota bacterium]
MKKYLFYIIITIFFHLTLLGQNLKFTHYTTEDGLSSATVWKIVQDKQGFIWIATQDGIDKFDAYTFQSFKFNPEDSNSVSDNNINDIFIDTDGIIWIATDYGLNNYDPKFNRFKRYLKLEAENKGPSDNTINCIAQDKENTIWLGTEGGGLNSFNKQNKKFTYYHLSDSATDSISKKHITCLYVDGDDELWIGTKRNGLFKYDKTKQKFISYFFSHNNNAYENAKNDITVIFEDSNKRLWIGTQKGGLNIVNRELNKLEDYTGYFTNSSEKLKYWITSIVEDNYNQIWIATKDGLTKIDEKKKSLDYFYKNSDDNPYSINSNNLTNLFIDASGSMWISNYVKGFDIVHTTIVNFFHYKKEKSKVNTLSSNIILAINKDEYGSLLVGSYGGGLCLVDRFTNKITLYNTLYPEISKAIVNIKIDNAGIIWLGTWGNGLQSFNRKTGVVKSYLNNLEDSASISNNTVITMYEDDEDENYLWVGTYNGLNKFDKKTQKFERFSEKEGLPGKKIYYITGYKDTLWIGTRGAGFSIYNKKKNSFENFQFDENDSTSISNNVINYIHNDKKGNLWISTELGLNCFNKKTKKFIRITEKDGLPDNKLWGILEDKNGNLWISSNNGICKYKPDLKSKNKGNFKNFYKSDGLQSNEFTQTGYFYDKKTNEMFFGGVNGFNAFYPDKIIENKYILPVHLISFKKMDNEVKFKDDTTIAFKHDIQVSWKENFIAFEFVGLDYTEPEKNLYSYKMEGLDINWSTPSTRRFAAYPNLSDGEYIFRVKAANNEGVWNEVGLSVHVTVNPPFWRTKWFISLSVIAIILSVLLYIRLRTKRLQYEKRILEETVEQRTQELRQKNEDITSSIEYAKRIQMAILPTFSSFYNEFPNSFILYKPKDIVSGDFFWFYTKGNKRIFAAADCTGHGVPGAFMSIIGNNLLEKIVNEKNLFNPAEILTELDKSIVEALNQKGRRDDSFDGMDIALCSHTKGNNYLEYAGAYRP